jgi:hypothetical protein
MSAFSGYQIDKNGRIPDIDLTSGASAVTTGVLAAIRSKYSWKCNSSSAVMTELRKSLGPNGSRADGTDIRLTKNSHDPDVGFGILAVHDFLVAASLADFALKATCAERE